MKQSKLDELALGNYNFINDEIEKLKKIKPFSDWKTHLQFKNDVRTGEPINLMTNDVKQLVQTVAQLLNYRNSFLEASKLLKLELDYEHQGYSFIEWLFDIKKLIENKRNRTKLSYLRERSDQVEKMLNEDVKREMDIVQFSKDLEKYKTL